MSPLENHCLIGLMSEKKELFIHTAFIWKNPTELFWSYVDRIPILNHTFRQGKKRKKLYDFGLGLRTHKAQIIKEKSDKLII